MKLDSMNDYEPIKRSFLAVISSTEQPHTFPGGLEEVRFERSNAEWGVAPENAVVLINPQGAASLSYLAEQILRRELYSEVWFSRQESSRIIQALESVDELAIRGLHLESDWLQLQVSLSGSESRSLEEFLQGLKIPNQNSKNPYVSPVPQAQSISWRGLLISQVLPLAKPVKKYLPTRIVVALYKFLEKIR